MKKWQVAGLSFLLILTLSACDLNMDSLGDGDTASDQGNSPLTAGEVIAKADKAFEQVNSYTVKSESQQVITVKTGGEETTIKSEILNESDWIKEPFQIHILTEARMEGMGPTKSEQYYVPDEGYYSKISDRNWVKLADPELQAKMYQSILENPETLIAQMTKLEKDIIFTEDKEYYVLSILLPESELKQMSEVASSNRDINSEVPSLLPIEITSMNLRLEISKDTFLLQKTTIEQEIKSGVEQNAVSRTKVEVSAYSNFNGIESIEVPQEVIEGAS